MMRDLPSKIEQVWAALAARASVARRPIIFTAAVVLLEGLFLSVRQHPEIFQNLDWHPIGLIALVITPAMVVLGALEFQLMARGLGSRQNMTRALHVTVVGTAVNLLPIPGAMMTRVTALKLQGASVKSGGLLTLLIGILWLGTALLLGGLGPLLVGQSLIGMALLLAGIAVTAVAGLLIRQIVKSAAIVFSLLAVRVVAVALDGLRVYLALKAIGFDIGLAYAMLFTLASAFGSALSVIPAGLGIRELFSGGLAPLVGIPAAAGFVAAFVIRLTDLAVIFGAALLLGFRGDTVRRAPDQ